MSKCYLEIELPKGCSWCDLTAQHYRGCDFADVVFDCDFDRDMQRHPKCPLKPMENLINADELVERIKEYIKDWHYTKEQVAVLKVIDIIEQMTKEVDE